MWSTLTPVLCDKATRKRAVSRDVPVPITLFLGKPVNFWVKVVKISTGLAETTKMPLKPDLTIGFTIDFKILTLVFTKSSLVIPGFLAAPAVITAISASLASL